MEVKQAVEYVNKLVNEDGQYGASWFDHRGRAHYIDDTTAYAYNGDFLVIAHKDRIYMFHEDDGSFIYHEDFDFNSAFTSSLIQLLAEIQQYITMVGIPYHFAPEKITRCGFALGIDIDKDER